MSKYLQWWVLWQITGSPVGSAIAVLVFWFLADRVTLRILPDPLLIWRRWRHSVRLRERITANPHDRKARFELADILVGRRRYAAAVEVLKPNLQAGDDDVPTLFLMGVACLGAQHAQQGEVFLEEARKVEPGYRLGAIDLELGRWRLAREDAKGAIEALERFCEKQPGTIEGKTLLSKARALAGDAAGAKKAGDEAWANYVTSPPFQRRRDRFWAWRVRPLRPVAYAVIALVAMTFVARVVMPPIKAAVQAQQASEYEGDE